VPRTIPLSVQSGTAWTASVAVPDVDWFRYYIHSVNKQGLEKSTPMYLVQRKSIDSVSLVADNDVFSFSVQPNPVHSVLSFSFELPAQGMWTLSINDLKGRNIITKKGFSSSCLRQDIKIETTDLAAGSYYALLRHADKVQTILFVVEK
jgi:hypothetical protein